MHIVVIGALLFLYLLELCIRLCYGDITVDVYHMSHHLVPVDQSAVCGDACESPFVFLWSNLRMTGPIRNVVMFLFLCNLCSSRLKKINPCQYSFISLIIQEPQFKFSESLKLKRVQFVSFFENGISLINLYLIIVNKVANNVRRKICSKSICDGKNSNK